MVLQMKKITSGEKLFYLIRDEALVQLNHRGVSWTNIGVLFDDLSGNPEFANYIKGATSIYIMRRLLRYWKNERDSIGNQSSYVKSVSRFIKDEVFPTLDTELISKISRSVINAVDSSEKAINPAVRKNVIAKRQNLTCYLCGHSLDPNAKEETETFLTLEHLWPTSIGGDSIEDNLMPACKKCQEDTKDTAAWEWLNIHNLVFSVNPSPEELKVSRKVRFAKHYFEAVKLAHSNNLSLKEAFMQNGPTKTPLSHTSTGLPITFFDLNSF
jgi:hypothetical protein